jgi:hypothetical protein
MNYEGSKERLRYKKREDAVSTYLRSRYTLLSLFYNETKLPFS